MAGEECGERTWELRAGGGGLKLGILFLSGVEPDSSGRDSFGRTACPVS